MHTRDQTARPATSSLLLADGSQVTAADAPVGGGERVPLGSGASLQQRVVRGRVGGEAGRVRGGRKRRRVAGRHVSPVRRRHASHRSGIGAGRDAGRSRNRSGVRRQRARSASGSTHRSTECGRKPVRLLRLQSNAHARRETRPTPLRRKGGSTYLIVLRAPLCVLAARLGRPRKQNDRQQQQRYAPGRTHWHVRRPAGARHKNRPNSRLVKRRLVESGTNLWVWELSEVVLMMLR